MKTLYLAGSSTRGANGKGVDWREYVKQLLDCPTIEPLADDYGDDVREEFVAIVKKGRRDIDACDILLANYIEPTVETSMEILYAWERGLIVVLVVESNNELNPWLRYHHHKMCFSLEDAAHYINGRLLLEAPSMATTRKSDLQRHQASSQ